MFACFFSKTVSFIQNILNHFDLDRDLNGGREKLHNVTFLEAYNCDSSDIPKPEHADRARKQLYRADYVPYHFVHYSTVTQGYLATYKQLGKLKWTRFYSESEPSERVTDEANEAIMIHAKTTDWILSSNYRSRCHYQFEKKWRGCFVGFPWPNNTMITGAHDADGMEYNCFVNYKVRDYWIPRLEAAVKRRQSTSLS